MRLCNSLDTSIPSARLYYAAHGADPVAAVPKLLRAHSGQALEHRRARAPAAGPARVAVRPPRAAPGGAGAAPSLRGPAEAGM